MFFLPFSLFHIPIVEPTNPKICYCKKHEESHCRNLHDERLHKAKQNQSHAHYGHRNAHDLRGQHLTNIQEEDRSVHAAHEAEEKHDGNHHGNMVLGVYCIAQ